MKRSVLFVYDPAQAGVTAHVRGFHFRAPLTERGWRTEFIAYTPPPPDSPRRTCRELAIALRARRFGIVYLLKVSSLSLVRRLEMAEARVVFDLTDSLWREEVGGSVWGDLDAILASSDAVFTCNTYDTRYATARNRRTVCLSPYADVSEFARVRADRPPRQGSGVRIGWIGSASTVRAVKNASGPIDRLAQRVPGLEFRVVGWGESADLPGMRHATLSLGPRVYDRPTMIGEILDMDVGIFPVVVDEEDYRVRGPLKTLNYMAGGVPSVSHRAGDVAQIVEDGVNGLLAADPEEWERKLERLARDLDLRRRIGLAGLETVRRSFSFEKAFGELETAFLEVLRMPRRRSRLPMSVHVLGQLARAAGQTTQRLLGRGLRRS